MRTADGVFLDRRPAKTAAGAEIRSGGDQDPADRTGDEAEEKTRRRAPLIPPDRRPHQTAQKDRQAPGEDGERPRNRPDRAGLGIRERRGGGRGQGCGAAAGEDDPGQQEHPSGAAEGGDNFHRVTFIASGARGYSSLLLASVPFLSTYPLQEPPRQSNISTRANPFSKSLA